MDQSLINETLKMLKGSLNPAGLKNDELHKTVTTQTGLVTYDLQAPSKNLYPVLTPLRNIMPRVSRAGNAGTATHWVQVSAINGSGYGSMGWVPQGQRSARMSYTTAPKSAAYATLGEEDALTFEAEAAAVGFEDENAMVTFRLLQKMMQKEENAILGGNASLDLDTPGTITVGSGGSGALEAVTYVVVIALTFEGYLNSSVSGGVATTSTFTGADGRQYSLNGGSSAPSAQQSTDPAAAAYITATVPAVEGAVAYAWYMGTTTGHATLQAITTINSVVVTGPLATTHQDVGTISGDHSANDTAYDGLLTTVFASGLGYVDTLATGTAGTGTPLTASGHGTVEEIDAMLETMWDSYKLGPSTIWVNSQEQTNITAKCLTGASSAPLLRVNQDAASQQAYQLTAGGRINMYYNPFTSEMIPVKVHPVLMPGTIVGYCEKLPSWYQSNQVPNVAEVITRRDYYRMDWPLRTREREYGVYAEEVLAVYAPFATGVINNIANG